MHGCHKHAVKVIRLKIGACQLIIVTATVLLQGTAAADTHNNRRAAPPEGS